MALRIAPSGGNTSPIKCKGLEGRGALVLVVDCRASAVRDRKI